MGIAGVGITLASAILLTALSYRFTLRPMKSVPRHVLTVIRFLFFTTLIFCLCRPTVTRRQNITDHGKRTIAVLIDDSSSMTQKALSGKTRFAQACGFWEHTLKPLSDQFDFKLYQFAQEIHPVESFKPSGSTVVSATHLYENITEWNNAFSDQNLSGVICMTDGIDTSDNSFDGAIGALSRSSIPHVFIPITTPVAGASFAAFRKLEVERVAKLNTQTPVTLVTATSGDEQSVLSVFEGDNVIYQASMPATGNPITRTHTFELSITQSGTHRYTAQIKQKDKVMAQTDWSVEGSSGDYVKALLYQGGLDWGTRYLRGVFDRDSRSELTVAFAPNAFPSHMNAERNETHLPDIETLSAYDVVIILNMQEDQMGEEMENTLRKFVSGGGSLLFIIANTLDAQAYINSPLEEFLPVEFESITDSSAYDSKTAQFLESMDSYRNAARSIRSTQSDGSIETHLVPPEMHPFQLTETGKRSHIFSYLTKTSAETIFHMPAFQDFALVKKCKPGARILAVHPELTVNHSPRILLAQQQFGDGQVAVLATDPLWRWKLSSPSSDLSFDEFWKGFMAWLGAGHIHATYWDIPQDSILPDIPVDCLLNLSSRTQVPTKNLRATLTDTTTGKTSRLGLSEINPFKFKITFTPQAGHQYQVKALNGTELITESFLTCQMNNADHKELRDLKPEVGVLRQLSSASFKHEFASIDSSRDWAHWIPEEITDNAPIKTEVHLWHKSWVFLIMLTLFMGELIVRRKYKLV